MALLALVSIVSLVAAAPLWSDESSVLEWLPALLSGVRPFQITTEAAAALLVAAGFSAGLLTEQLRKWRRQGRLAEQLTQLAAALVDRLDVEDDEDREERKDLAITRMGELVNEALDAEDKSGSSPPRKKAKAAAEEPGPSQSFPPPPPVMLEQATAATELLTHSWYRKQPACIAVHVAAITPGKQRYYPAVTCKTCNRAGIRSDEFRAHVVTHHLD